MKLGKVRRAMMHESWYYRWRKPPKTPKIPNERAHAAPSPTSAAGTPTVIDDDCRGMAEGLFDAIKAMSSYKAHLAEWKASGEEITPELKSKMTMMRRETNVTFPLIITVTGGTQWAKVFAAAYGYLTAGLFRDDPASIDRAVATLQNALDSGP